MKNVNESGQMGGSGYSSNDGGKKRRIDLKYRPEAYASSLAAARPTEATTMGSSVGMASTSQSDGVAVARADRSTTMQSEATTDGLLAPGPAEIDAWEKEAASTAPVVESPVIAVHTGGRFELAGGSVLEVGPEPGRITLTPSTSAAGGNLALTPGRTRAVTVKSGDYYATVIYAPHAESESTVEQVETVEPATESGPMEAK